MMAVGVWSLSFLLAFFVAIDTSEVYPPEVRETFVENALVAQTFTQQLPADTAVVFMTGNFGVCKSKKGMVVRFSELASFLKKVVGATASPTDELVMLDGMEHTVRSFLRMFHGEVGIALLNFPIGRGSPDFIVRADVDESERSFTDMARSIGTILSIAAKSFVREEDGYLVIRDKLYVKITDKKLYGSNSRLVIEQFLSGAWKGNSLSDSPLYREMGKRVEFDQEQFLFVNAERMWEGFTAAGVPEGGRLNTIFGGLVSNIRAIASSKRLSRGDLKVVSSVLFKGLAEGLPRILARPNARSQAGMFVPPDYSLLVRVHTGSPVGLLKDIMALHEDAAGEIRGALEEMSERLGFDVEEDLLRALSGDFAVAAKVPAMVGLPEALAIVRVADYDKASSVLGRVVEKAGLAPFEEEYRGGKLCMFAVPLMTLTYSFVEGHLLVGTSPNVVRDAIDAHLSGRNLAGSEGYRRAFEGHPSENFVAIYADSEAIFDGLLNIGGGLAMCKRGREGRQVVVPLIGLLRRNVKELVPLSCTVYRREDAIMLRANSRLFGAGPAPMLLPGLVLIWRAEARPDVMMERGEGIGPR